MTRIGLTQRVEVVEAYEERRDCLDQRWGRLLRSLDYTPIPLFNKIEDVAEYLDDLDIDGIILTGGNDLTIVENGSNVAPERDSFERELLEVAIDQDIPVLGVCRGIQMINVFFEGSLSAIDGHVATTHEISINGSSMESDFETVHTNSYHSFGIEPSDLADDLRAIGYTPDGAIEWIKHDTYPIQAIMWHPERAPSLTDFDRRIITDCFGSAKQ